MPFENKDVRLVDGGVDAVFCGVKDYLKSNNFEIGKEEQLGDSAFVKGINLGQSVIRLFLSAYPQIVLFHIEKKSDDRVQIEIRFDLLMRFRVFYFSYLCSFLIIFGSFYKLSKFGDQAESAVISIYFLSLGFIGALFLVLALLFKARMLNTTPYENFVEDFYTRLSSSGISCKAVLQSGYTFPDIWKSLIVFITLIFVFIVMDKDFLAYFSDIAGPGLIFYIGLIVVIGILLTLLFVMLLRSAAVTRLLFCLVGISICLPVAIYGNAPALNFLMSDVTEKIEHINKNHDGYEKVISENSITSGQLNTRLADYKKASLGGLLIVLFFWLSIITIIVFLAWNAVNLPIKIIRQLGRFNSPHSESLYHKALKPEKSSLLFGGVILLLWLVVSAANLAGLYFSFSILERLIFGTNYVLSSDIASLFFDDTKTMFALLLQGHRSEVYHKLIMIGYSLPMVFIFSFVLMKNFGSFVKTVYLLKFSNRFFEAEKHLSEKVADICRHKGLPVPIIRVENSSSINSKTKYLSFPFFKNILTVTKGACDELDEYELDALIAHEILHQKKHTLRRKLLLFLSDYSLFGNGFLALLQNSYQVEKEADVFAKEWLEQKLDDNKDAVNLYASLLKKQRRHNTLLKTQPFFDSNALSFDGFKDDAETKKILESYRVSSRIRKAWINFTLLFQMYFGHNIISYFHPSVEQRVSWVEQIIDK